MFDAIDLGYEVVYLYDCIAGASAESEAEIRALAEIFQPIHTTVMSSEEYLAAIGADEMEANRRESEVESNGEVYVLFTSDVHCGIDQGFGYAGLKQIRDTLEAQGYRPMNGDVMMECCTAPMAAKSYDLDIAPNDISVSDTVTVVWEIG